MADFRDNFRGFFAVAIFAKGTLAILATNGCQSYDKIRVPTTQVARDLQRVSENVSDSMPGTSVGSVANLLTAIAGAILTVDRISQSRKEKRKKQTELATVKIASTSTPK